MLLSRRKMIQAGAATGAAVLIPSSLRAQDSAYRIRPDRGGDYAAYPRPVYASARPYADPVIDRRLLARARASFDRHRASLANIDVVCIVDFTQASAEQRFYLLDTQNGRVTRHLVAHGRGSDPAHTGFLHYFSNRPGSVATSNGAYVTSEYYAGQHGRAMRVRGLDYTNSNAEARAIVVHSAWYAEPQVLAEQGRLGRSEGCFALPYRSLQEVLGRLGPGRFLYADRLA